MQKNKTTQPKKWPAWAGWLLGYLAVLAAAAGLVYFWRVVFLLPENFPALLFTLGLMGLFTLLYGAFCLLCRIRDGNLCLKAAGLVFVLGLLFCFATAPLQAPDENKHYLRAVSVSMGRFTYDYNEQYPNDVDLLVGYFPPAMNHRLAYQGGSMASQAMAAYKAAVEGEKIAPQPAKAPIMYLLIPFLHQGLFMAVARLFGLSALGLLYAGRIANLALYAGICWLAFRNAGRWRPLFFAFALLPLSLFMAASCSYDGLVLAVCFLLASYLCKTSFTARDLLVFCVALAVITYIKPNNFLLAALLLFIPKDRWRVKWNPWLSALVAAAAAGVLWKVLGSIDGGVLKIGWPTLPRGSGDAADPAAQMLFILQNPLRFGAVMLQTIYEDNAYLFDLGRYGWMDLVIPLAGGLSLLSLCFGCVQSSARPQPLLRKHGMPGLAALGIIYSVAVLAGMYVSDTDLYSIRITGQQPRYFIPAFLLLFMAGAMVLSHLLNLRDNIRPEAAKTAEKTALWVAAAVALVVVMLLFQNYYIGQWLRKAAGGWKLVNLFGWVQK